MCGLFERPPMFRFSRPLIFVAIAFGVALYFALLPWLARPIARALIGWDGGIAVLLILTYAVIVRPGGQETEHRILGLQGKGNPLLAFAVLASVASVAGLGAETSGAKAHQGATFAIVLAVATIVLSWVLIQLVFALRYAHEYFANQKNGSDGGLNFVEPGQPDFWDFVHFSVVLGAASQTADIVFTRRDMRRIGTLHTLVAFGFNTAILATLINVLLTAMSS
jgi:uncharacterized membrane protein